MCRRDLTSLQIVTSFVSFVSDLLQSLIRSSILGGTINLQALRWLEGEVGMLHDYSCPLRVHSRHNHRAYPEWLRALLDVATGTRG